MAKSDGAENPLSTLLVAAMLGVATSTGLGPGRLSYYQLSGIERLLDDDVEFALGEHEQERPLILPSYSGRVDDLTSSDLAGTGDLVRLYAPKLFVPDLGIVTMHNVTTTYPIKSGLFQVYQFEEADRILRPLPERLLAHKPVSELTEIFRDMNPIKAGAVIRHIAGQVLQSSDIPAPHAEAIYAMMREQEERLTTKMSAHFAQVYKEISVLKSLIPTERAVAEDVHRKGAFPDLKKAIRGTPQRLVEKVIDKSVEAATEIVVKVFAAALCSS